MVRIKPVKIVQRGRNYRLYYYNPRGERRRLSAGSDYQQAQRMAVKFSYWLMEGKDPESEIDKAASKEQTKAIKFREFFPVFMQRHGATRSKKMQISYEGSFKKYLPLPLNF